MPVALELTAPLWLLALLPLATFLALARRPWWDASGRPIDRAVRQREIRRFAFRLGWAALLVLALAGMTIVWPLNRQAVIFALDSSASTAPVRDRIEATVRQGEHQQRPGDLLGVVAVADGARIEEAPTASPTFRQLQAALPDDATDLAAGLRLAGAALPGGYAGRIVLVSDGRQTRGDAVGAARDLAARGVTVDVLPLGPTGGADLRLEAVDLPSTASLGEVATLTARLNADRATGATLRVYRDDALVLERSVQLQTGRQDVALPVPVGDPGLHRYRVEVAAQDPAADRVAADDQLGAIQRVVGPPRVLVVAPSAAEAGYLPGALRAGGAAVDVVQPAAVPADLAGWARYDAVVLDDVPADALPSGSMDLLERDVRDLGRGLVMVGGPDSFGPGGYAGTPVERALPVSMDLTGRGREPRVALLLVIDKSGSMGGLKIELAKEAAIRSVGLLRPGDQAGVLAFDSVPQWVIPLTSAAERDRIDAAIGGIDADDGTEIYPAVAAAFGALRDASADVKHIILLTDGQSATGGDYPALLGQMRDARISLSTVAIGDDADTSLLEAMARADRGRYYFAADPAAIPQIFARETILATRSIFVDRHFTPAASAPSPLLRGLGAVPALDGYVAVTPKGAAEVSLVSPEGDPVLAAWQYGLGRAVAWTPDVAGRWSAAWDGQPAAATLWGNVLSWLLPPPSGGELTVQAAPADDATLSIVAEDRQGWDAVRPTRATLIGPGGQTEDLPLAPAGPGRYQATLQLPKPGAYVVQATQEVGGGGELRAETGWVAPYSAEYRDEGLDPAFLAQIARAGGGELLSDPAVAMATPPRTVGARLPLAPLLLVLAAILWPIEIASRRLEGIVRVPLPALSLPIFKPVRHPDTRQAAATPDGSSPTTAPAASTTGHLLERKHAFREGRSIK